MPTAILIVSKDQVAQSIRRASATCPVADVDIDAAKVDLVADLREAGDVGSSHIRDADECCAVPGQHLPGSTCGRRGQTSTAELELTDPAHGRDAGSAHLDERSGGRR